MEHLAGKYFIRNNQLLAAAHFDPLFITAGRSVYEVIRIVKGVPLFMEEHLERLKKSVILIDQPLFITEREINQQMQRLIEQCAIDEGNLKLVLHYNFTASDACIQFYAYFIEHSYPIEDAYRKGVDTITFSAVRSNPNAKVADLALRESINKEIQKQNVFEAILLDEDDCITEGSRSNIFMIKEMIIYTAPLLNVLPGITRCKVLDICRQQNFYLKEKKLRLIDLSTMDAIFLTGTSPKVLPIKRVDNLCFDSAAHPLVNNIMKQYDDLVNSYTNKYL